MDSFKRIVCLSDTNNFQQWLLYMEMEMQSKQMWNTLGLDIGKDLMKVIQNDLDDVTESLESQLSDQANFREPESPGFQLQQMKCRMFERKITMLSDKLLKIQQKNEEAVGFMKKHVTQQICRSIAGMQNAVEIMDNLKGRFQKEIGYKNIVNLYVSAMSMKIEPKEAPIDCVQRILDQLQRIDLALPVEDKIKYIHRMPEQFVISLIFLALGPEYEITQEILSAKAHLGLDMVKVHLEQLGKRGKASKGDGLSKGSKSGDTVAFKASGGSSQNPKNAKANVLCSYCHRNGHIAAKCWKKRDNSNGNQQKSNGNQERTAEAKLAKSTKPFAFFTVTKRECKAVSNAPNTWIIDTGATHHMTNDKSHFVDYKLEDIDVHPAGRGHILKCVGTGTINGTH